MLLCSITPEVNEGRECLVSVQRLWPENNKLQSLLNLQRGTSMEAAKHHVIQFSSCTACDKKLKGWRCRESILWAVYIAQHFA